MSNAFDLELEDEQTQRMLGEVGATADRVQKEQVRIMSDFISFGSIQQLGHKPQVIACAEMIKDSIDEVFDQAKSL